MQCVGIDGAKHVAAQERVQRGVRMISSFAGRAGAPGAVRELRAILSNMVPPASCGIPVSLEFRHHHPQGLQESYHADMDP